MDCYSRRPLVGSLYAYPRLWYGVYYFSVILTHNNVNTGEIPWLFQPNFYDCHRYHLGFTVSSEYKQYNNASLHRRIVRTTSPDPFYSDEAGVAPPGHVCVTVTGHNRGSGIQHHIIPAKYLRPANPIAKNQLCLVIKGTHASEIVVVKKCQKSIRMVVSVNDEAAFSFDDVCLVYQSASL